MPSTSTVPHRGYNGEPVPSATLSMSPNTCPLCHHAGEPRTVIAMSCVPNDNRIEVAFQCLVAECRSMFFGLYERSSAGNPFILQKTYPQRPLRPTVPQDVLAISPSFLEVYTQALAAESAGLDQITGIGLRKALEFLVKDFAIAQNPKDKEKIEKQRLGTCIKEYLEDPNLKSCAKRAAWLGNDETHYVRIWEDRDIDDLKVLIRLTMNWAENVLLTAKYSEEMPDKQKNV